MKILYFSCHSVLEEQEIKLFTQLGHDVFSLGVYQNNNQGSALRGEVPGLYENHHLRNVALTSPKENIHQELIDWADIIFLMHNAPSQNHPQPWLMGNWDRFKKSKKPIIWRSIGQSSESVERSIEKFRKEGLKIIRYSPKEDTIPHYVGSDAMIRFYADPTEFDGYQGNIPRIVNVSQAMFGSKTVPSRGDHMNIKEFGQVVHGFDWKIFGPDNERAGENDGGRLPFEDLKAMLRFNRVFLYTGTRPASYTLGFIEAFMTGIPIVSIGEYLGNSVYTNQKTFEVPDLIGENGKAGYYSDSVDDLRRYCKMLLEDQELAREVGKQGRLRAIQHFGKDIIAAQWKDFFRRL